MNNDFDNTNSGAMFPNDRRQNDKSPDFKGQCEPVCPSCGTINKFWLSGWKKKGRNGKGFLSLAMTADNAEQNKPTTKPDDKKDDFDFDEDIPF